MQITRDIESEVVSKTSSATQGVSMDDEDSSGESSSPLMAGASGWEMQPFPDMNNSAHVCEQFHRPMNDF